MKCLHALLIITWILGSTLFVKVCGQSTMLIGIAPPNLVEVNAANGEVSVISYLGFTQDHTVKTLSYFPPDCRIYALVDNRDEPALVRFDLDGSNYEWIGRITLNGLPVALVEGLAYDSSSMKLHASASVFTGVADNDFFCETLLELDENTAGGISKGNISTNLGERDMDAIVFSSDQLIYGDSKPSGPSFFYLLSTSIAEIQNTQPVSALMYSPVYWEVTDLAQAQGVIYFSRSGALYRYNQGDILPTLIGQTLDNNTGMTVGLTGLTNVDNNLIAEIAVPGWQDTVICPNDVLTLSIPWPDATVEWPDGSTGLSWEIDSAGIYSARIILDGCMLFTEPIEVSIREVVVPSLGEDAEFCEGESIVLIAPSEYEEVSWINMFMGQQLVVFEPGEYWYSALWYGCPVVSDTLAVEVIPIQNVFIAGWSDTVLCPGEMLTLTLPFAGVEVIWSDGSTGSSLEIGQPGLYFARVMLDNCWSLTQPVQVGYHEVVRPVLGGDQVLCDDESLLLSAPVGYSNVQWLGTIGQPSLVVEETGTYWFEAEWAGCPVTSDTIQIEFVGGEEWIVPGWRDTVLCAGESLWLEVPWNGAVVQWSDGTVGPSIEIKEAGEYFARISIDDCWGETQTINVDYYNAIGPSLGDDQTLCEGEVLLLSADDSVSNVVWVDSLAQQSILISNSGLYWYTGVDEYGCMVVSDTLAVQFEFCVGCKISTVYIPNSFSPNEDGVNDWFTYYLGEETCPLEFVKLLVFDRWGGLVFSGEQATEVRWHGKYGDALAAPGVYVYLLELQFRTSFGLENRQYSGDVTLIR